MLDNNLATAGQAGKPQEKHSANNYGWLRAAVLGANDGILSVSSIVTGMAAGNASSQTLFLAGIAALAAGATAMATGEYVSVSSQADSEKADLIREQQEIADNPEQELAELAQIYQSRGLSKELSHQVATELMAKDPLAAHARDELGINETMMARPLQAAFASSLSFIFGGIIPLLVAIFSNHDHILTAVTISALAALGILGAMGAYAGGVKIFRPTVRIILWGIVSMSITALVGMLFKVNI